MIVVGDSGTLREPLVENEKEWDETIGRCVVGGETKELNRHYLWPYNHELSYYDTQLALEINNEENCQTVPFNKAKRIIFDRCTFLRRAGKVLDQLNIISFGVIA